MRIRIVQAPSGEIFGINLGKFRVDCVYDVAPPLAEFLIIEKFAIPEIRDAVTTEDKRRRRE